jgi:TonB family protein
LAAAIGGQGAATPYGIRDASEFAEVPGNRSPDYPERDRLMRNQGTAVFVARVKDDGTVTDIRLEQSARSSSLDISAMSAMKRWRFLPGQAGWVRKGFNFVLGNHTEERPGRLRR